jgi:hypothetical protein
MRVPVRRGRWRSGITRPLLRVLDLDAHLLDSQPGECRPQLRDNDVAVIQTTRTAHGHNLTVGDATGDFNNLVSNDA